MLSLDILKVLEQKYLPLIDEVRAYLDDALLFMANDEYRTSDEDGSVGEILLLYVFVVLGYSLYTHAPLAYLGRYTIPLLMID